MYLIISMRQSPKLCLDGSILILFASYTVWMVQYLLASYTLLVFSIPIHLDPTLTMLYKLP